MVDDAQYKEIKDEIEKVKADFTGKMGTLETLSMQIKGMNDSLTIHSRKLDEFLKIATDHAVLEEKYKALDKKVEECNKDNKESHDKIFDRLRIVENPKEEKMQLMTIVWDMVKIIIGILIALFISGKVKTP